MAVQEVVSSTPWPRLFCAIATTIILGTPALADPPRTLLTLGELLALPEERLAEIDIAAMNLACAIGAPGSENIDPDALLAKVDSMAERVGQATFQSMQIYQANPIAYGSFGRFAMRVMTIVLQDEFGVKYNPKQIESPTLERSQDLFINGLLDGTGGTCASMPVLYIAVGRRLGYPLKMVNLKQHYFVRWDDPTTGERFNLEATLPGFVVPPDHAYQELRPVSHEELEQSNYLESLSPREELSFFITSRADSMSEYFNLKQLAAQYYELALELCPRNGLARLELGRVRNDIRKIKEQFDVQRHIPPEDFLVPEVLMPVARPLAQAKEGDWLQMADAAASADVLAKPVRENG